MVLGSSVVEPMSVVSRLDVVPSELPTVDEVEVDVDVDVRVVLDEALDVVDSAVEVPLADSDAVTDPDVAVSAADVAVEGVWVVTSAAEVPPSDSASAPPGWNAHPAPMVQTSTAALALIPASVSMPRGRSRARELDTARNRSGTFGCPGVRPPPMPRLARRFAPALVLLGATLLAAPACDPDQFGLEPAASRIVLTPGGSATVRIDIVRPASLGQDAHLYVFGLPSGVSATLSDYHTGADHVELTLEVADGVEALEDGFSIKGRIGPYVDIDPMTVSVQVLGEPQPGAEEYAPGVDGQVETLVMNGEEVTFEVIDGVAVTHGDIVLGNASALREEFRDDDDGFRSATCNYGFHTDFTCSPWTDGVVGYQFANNWGDAAENQRMRDLITDAMDHWEEHTPIRFVPRASGEYLEFRDGGGCSSTVGRAVITGFDSQSISLNNNGCDDVGIAIHEIGHAVGLYHEQSRDDRDDHVVVDFGRVRDGKLHNFFQWGEAERDQGAYDYNSIMHYGRSAFARNRPACEAGNLAECTVRPDDTSAMIGQRVELSEGDILGVYTLYPPQYVIEGASEGEVGDRFFLTLDYDTPTPNADYITWTSDRVTEPLGTGHFLNLRASDVPDGLNVITATFTVANLDVISQSVTVDISNDTPDVSLAANNGMSNQNLGQVFTVSSTVTDAEDGTCPPELCVYSWSPTPTSGPTDGRTANYTFNEAGSQTITLSVEDRGGAVGSGSLTVGIVNTAPTISIVEPAGNVTLAEGINLSLEADASDPNGPVSCNDLSWSSSDGSDTIGTGCTPTATFGGPGTRTITVTATDPQGATSAADSVQVTVTGCAGGNCDPTATLGVGTPHFADSYFIELPIDLVLTIADAESGALAYEVRARRAGEADAVFLDSSFAGPAGTVFNLERSVTLEEEIAPWPFCSSTSEYRSYELILTVDDGDGGVTTDSQVLDVGCSLN